MLSWILNLKTEYQILLQNSTHFNLVLYGNVHWQYPQSKSLSSMHGFSTYVKVIQWDDFFLSDLLPSWRQSVSQNENEIPPWNNADRHLCTMCAVINLHGDSQMTTPPYMCAQACSEGAWSFKWRGPLKTFDFWAKMLIFDTIFSQSCLPPLSEERLRSWSLRSRSWRSRRYQPVLP